MMSSRSTVHSCIDFGAICRLKGYSKKKYILSTIVIDSATMRAREPCVKLTKEAVG